jgi:hypothetical protein
MIVVKSYTVMTMTVVEVSCIHSVDPLAAHLVYRVQVTDTPRNLWEWLMGLAETIHEAGRSLEHGELLETDDCLL